MYFILERERLKAQEDCHMPVTSAHCPGHLCSSCVQPHRYSGVSGFCSSDLYPVREPVHKLHEIRLESPFPQPLARTEPNALDGICNLQFFYNIVSGVSRWMRQEGAGRKLREGNIISNSFMIYLFAPCDCRGIFNYTKPGCAQCCMPWSSEQLPKC